MPESAPCQPGSQRWRKWLAIGAAVWGALIAAGDLYVLSTTRGALVATLADAPARAYVVVLGNRIFPDGLPSRELAARLETGRRLYAAGRARRIIVSGRSRPDYDEPRAMATWLEARGVPAADVVLDLGGYRTAATMADTAALGARSVLVATQARRGINIDTIARRLA